jgi:hypothetical protein
MRSREHALCSWQPAEPRIWLFTLHIGTSCNLLRLFDIY